MSLSISWRSPEMHNVTAFYAASLRIDSAIVSIYVAPITAEIMPFIPQLSENRPESLIYSPRPSLPAWLHTVQQRIRNSILPQAQKENDGRWLSGDIAKAGSDFFQKTADLLTGEPFIYSSCEGDLVAEFSAEHGTMTSIVSSNFVLLFAVVDNVPL